MDFALGQGDNDVPWDVPILDGDGNPIDVTGATILFHFRINDASTPAVEVAGTVSGAAPETRVRLTFLAANTGTPGIYDTDVIITLNGETFSYPACIGRRSLQFEIFEKP